MEEEQKTILKRIVITSFGLIGINVLKLLVSNINLILLSVIYAFLYILISYDIITEAAEGVLKGEVFDENFLMSIASIGAFSLAIYEKNGDFNEAVFVVLFYKIGEFFEDVAVGKSRKNIIDLMNIRPDYATIEVDGKLKRVNPDSVEIGSVIIVHPGEKIPIDGVVIYGSGLINTSALTGESVPREVSESSAVQSGCISLNSILKIRTEKLFCESTVSKVLELVESASSRKAKSEAFISKFAKFYTPIVCCSALALVIIPPVISFFIGLETSWSIWFYRALIFLVISCPCALVISIPLTFFAGIGGAGHNGILIKGSNFLETLSKVKTVVFDKTGTLTKGVFQVEGIHHSKFEESELLEIAAHAEYASSHPISRSLQSAFGKDVDRKRVSEIKEISGEGIIAKLDGKEVAIGNEKLMTRIGSDFISCHHSGTVIHIALEGSYAGHILISDVIKPTSGKAVSELKRIGILKTVMLTGDSQIAAEEVGKKLGIDEVYSELLPDSKVHELEKLLKSSEGNLAFVGDGINDAPVLSRSDVGIAMGALGSDAAIEAADVVLMDDDPVKIVKAIEVSRKCMKIVHQNIVFAIGVKFLCLSLGALGLAGMWIAIFADVGVMILSVLNSIRVLKG